MTQQMRKLVLTLHITFSVGWLGAVTVFLVLNLTAHERPDPMLVRASFLAMNLIAWSVILPFCFGSLITGLLQSLATKWGLFKHYWVTIKLFLTAGSTILLLLHMQLINRAAKIAMIAQLPNSELNGIGTNLLTKSVLATFVLLITTIISVYKPWGKIQITTRSNKSLTNMEEMKQRKKSWKFYILLTIIVLIIIIVGGHLLTGGMSEHSQ